MHPMVKGALSASAALVLLAGGAGSLAFWSAEDPVTGTSLDGGRLDILTDATNLGCGDWMLDDAAAGPTAHRTTDALVPGDVLTRHCDFTIAAQGTHLRATVGLDSPTFSGADGDFDDHLDATVTGVTVAGAPRSGFTSADDGKRLSVEVRVVWDEADTAHMGSRSVLDDLTLLAEQVHSA